MDAKVLIFLSFLGLAILALQPTAAGKCTSDKHCKADQKCEEICKWKNSKNSGNADGTTKAPKCKQKCRKFSCKESEFMCRDQKECIKKSLRCDGNDDCTDKTDEKRCPFTCGDGEFKCLKVEKCLDTKLMCNGMYDCGRNDHSDEVGCTRCHESRWELKAVITKGGTISSKHELIEAARRGAEIKVFTPLTQLSPAKKVRIFTDANDEEQLEVQALHFLVRQFNKTRMVLDVYFIEVDVLTDGTMRFTFVNGSTGMVIDMQPETMSFFTRERRDPDRGSNLKAIRSGAKVKVHDQTTNAIYPIDRVDICHSTFTGLSTQELYPDQVNKHDWTFRLFYENGSVVSSSWDVGTHNPDGSSEAVHDLKVLVDPCWTTVYEQDEDGDPIGGDFDELKKSIEKGNRLMVLFGGKLVKASVVRYDGTNVIATIFNSLSTDDVNAFKNDVTWEWCDVSTDGYVTCVKQAVGVGEQRGEKTEELMTIKWIIDERKWELKGTVDGPGGVDDVVEPVKSAAKAGQDVRYSFDLEGVTLYYEAENLYIEGDHFSVSHTREFVFSDDGPVLRRYTVVSSLASVDLAEYYAETTTKKRHEHFDNVPIKFFVAK